MDDATAAELVARIDALERTVAALQSQIIGPRVVAPMAQPAKHAPQHRAPSTTESIFAGRGLLFAGALLVILGVGFFLKLAFDSGWIGPSMRVAMGIIAGTLLAIGARRARTSVSPLFVDALTALGGSIVYLSVFSADNLFHLIPHIVTLLATTIITAGLFSLAYSAQRITLAHFALIGGLFSPVLVGMNWIGPIGFLVYFGALNIIAVSICELRSWRSVQIVAVIFTWLFAALEIGGPSHNEFMPLVALIGTYLVLAIATSLVWKMKETVTLAQGFILGINVAGFLFTTSAFYETHRPTLAITFLGIALAHIIAGRLLGQRSQLGLAIVALTFAIPPTFWSFEKIWPTQAILLLMHLAWIAEGLIVAILAIRSSNRLLGSLSILAFVTVIGDLLMRYGDGSHAYAFLLNERFASLIALALALTYSRHVLMRTFASEAATRYTWARIPVDLCFLVGLMSETHGFAAAYFPLHADGAQAVAESIILGGYGASLAWYGLRKNAVVARGEGLALLAITALKVVFFDLVGFTQVVRIISALAIGIVLLVVAYFYQRTTARTSEDTTP